MLFAERGGVTMAVGCSASLSRVTCGFAGISDGLTQLRQTCELQHFYNEATCGNVALTAEIDWRTDCEFCVAVAFGETGAEAAQQVRAALLQRFPIVRQKWLRGWNEVLDTIVGQSQPASLPDFYRISIAACRIHESKRFPGAFVASLSIPWGCDRSDGEIGGYHVVWPRDLCEVALGLLSAGDADSARRALFYLECTQNADGSWGQNMWLDGTRHWTSTQMDAIAFPILLADALRRRGQMQGNDAWPWLNKPSGFWSKTVP